MTEGKGGDKYFIDGESIAAVVMMNQLHLSFSELHRVSQELVGAIVNYGV